MFGMDDDKKKKDKISALMQALSPKEESKDSDGMIEIEITKTDLQPLEDEDKKKKIKL